MNLVLTTKEILAMKWYQRLGIALLILFTFICVSLLLVPVFVVSGILAAGAILFKRGVNIQETFTKTTYKWVIK